MSPFPGPLFRARDDRDRERFLEYVSKCVETCQTRVYFFCLMTNHVHLVLETPGGNLGRFMQLLQTSYGHFYHRRHERVGHLFQGRYKARLVEAEEYLNALSRYVHLNPVFVGRLRGASVGKRRLALRRYRWSSLPGYFGCGSRFDFVEYGPVLSGFGRSRGRQGSAYREYVESGIACPDENVQERLRKPWPVIGGDGFRAWVMERHEKLRKGRSLQEDVSFRKEAARLSIEEVLDAVGKVLGTEPGELMRRRRGTQDRGIAAQRLCRYAGLTQREAARALGVGTGAAVGWRMGCLRKAVQKDRRLRARVNRVERELDAVCENRRG